MKNNNILRWSIIVGIFLVPFVPLVISSNLFFPFISGKNFTFRLLSEIIFGLWLILAVRDAEYRPKMSWILKAFLVFLGLIAISDGFASPNPMKSFWSNFERMDGYITLLHLLFFFIVTATVLDSKKIWTRFLQTSIAVSLIVGLYGFCQYLGSSHWILAHANSVYQYFHNHFQIDQGGERIDATLGNATYFAVYMMFHVFFLLFLLSRERLNKWMQWLYGVLIVFELFVIYRTATRGVLLGLIVGALVVTGLIALFETERKSLRKGALVALSAVVLFVIAFFGLKNTDFVKNNPVLGRFTSINYNEAKPRLYVWNMAFQGFKERPIFGWGQESFNYVFNKYYDPRMYTQEQWFDRTHDIFFDWLIAGGALGLLSYLSLFVALLYYIWRGFHFKSIRHRRLRSLFEKVGLIIEGEEHHFSLADRALLTGLLAAYFFQNIFVFDNIASYIPFMYVLAFVHSTKGVALSQKWQKKLALTPSNQNTVAIPIIIVVTLFGIYFFNYKGYQTGVTLIEALRPQQAGVLVNLKSYEQALAYHSFGDAEIREQLIQQAINVLNSGADTNTKQQYFDLARREIQAQVDKTPDDARYQLFAGTFLARFHLFDDAQVYLDKALALSPRKQSILFEVGSNYLNRSNPAKAVQYFKQAYDLEPSYTTARDFYTVSLIYDNKEKEADKILTDAYGTVLVLNDQIIKAYADTKQYDRVISIWKQRVSDTPNDYAAHTSLAAAYLQAGQRESAVAELQKAIALNPDFKEQGTYYINEIRAGRNP